MKAVSSPALSDSPLKSTATANASTDERYFVNDCINLNSTAAVHPQNVSHSVFQRLKNTLTHLKYKPMTATSTLPVTTTSATTGVGNSATTSERGKYRLGPLVWRSNKEPKNKEYRATKCNSGDSGIQVEINASTIDQLRNDSNASLTLPIRRANSSKETSSLTLKNAPNLKYHPKNSIPLSKRSYSQPYGLDCVTTDLNDYDSDTQDLIAKERNTYNPVFAEVLYTFKAMSTEELTLEKGALVEVIKRDAGPWWWGRLKHEAILSNSNGDVQNGWFPKDFVRIIPQYTKNHRYSYQHPSDDISIDLNKKFMSLPLSKSKKMPKQTETTTADFKHNQAMAKNAIKELLDTEINYVKLLSSLCEGYLSKLKQRSDVFSADSLNIIFSNIEQIWEFQQNFLNALQTSVEQHKVAETFLEYQSAFMIYSTYCNSYPRALMELETYTGNIESSAILKNCRINENLPDLPLSAHLLVPIQRICRYPLHLGELAKHSPCKRDLLQYSDTEILKSDVETMDCQETFEFALNAMKRITEIVNEGKRHSEYLTRIQARFDNFQGPPLNVHSTKLFLQTDVIRVTPNLWNHTYTLFLFDRQLVYCKKDILKRTNYLYKGRIYLDNCRVINLADGKLFGVTFKNTVRLYSNTKNKWFDFSFRSSSSKLRFLNTLSIERQFCGQSLFITEFENFNDICPSDKEDHSDYEDGKDGRDSVKCNRFNEGSFTNEFDAVAVKSSKYLKKSETLPKKSGKQQYADGTKFAPPVPPPPLQECHGQSSATGGRRRFGYWVRRAKSTNSTPSHSPTHSNHHHHHHQHQHQSVVQSTTSIVSSAASCRSSQNSLIQQHPN